MREFRVDWPSPMGLEFGRRGRRGNAYASFRSNRAFVILDIRRAWRVRLLRIRGPVPGFHLRLGRAAITAGLWRAMFEGEVQP